MNLNIVAIYSLDKDVESPKDENENKSGGMWACLVLKITWPSISLYCTQYDFIIIGFLWIM